MPLGQIRKISQIRGQTTNTPLHFSNTLQGQPLRPKSE
jgi:hypothetical protein